MIRTVSLCCLVALLSACTQQIDVEENHAELVDTAELSSQLLYLDLAVSPRPMTADEVGDARFATPIRIEFFRGWAIAWWAPEGEAVRGTPENALAAWEIEYAQPLEGRVDNSGGGSTQVANPEAPASVTNQQIGISTGVSIGSDVGIDRYDFVDQLPFAKIQWLRERVEEWRALPPTFHPGCD